MLLPNIRKEKPQKSFNNKNNKMRKCCEYKNITFYEHKKIKGKTVTPSLCKIVGNIQNGRSSNIFFDFGGLKNFKSIFLGKKIKIHY